MSSILEERRRVRAKHIINLYETTKGSKWREKKKNNETLYERYAVLFVLSKLYETGGSTSIPLTNLLSEYMVIDRTTIYHAYHTTINLISSHNPPKLLVDCLSLAMTCYNEAHSFSDSEYDIRKRLLTQDLNNIVRNSLIYLSAEDVSSILKKVADECSSID